MRFTAPSQSTEFYEEVFRRCTKLISLNYWDRIDKYTFESWLTNFTTDDEKYFAAQILFHFQYRNQKALISMVKQIIQVNLPQKLDELGIYTIESISKWETILRTDKSFSLPFRFSTINKEGQIGESGDALFRTIAQHDIVYKGIGRFIDRIDTQKSQTVILIDDIAGSGDQFYKFYLRYINIFRKFKYIIYCPLVVHEDAISRIENIPAYIVSEELKKFRFSTSKLDFNLINSYNISEKLQINLNIHVVPAEILKIKSTFFGISDKINTNQDFVDFYTNLISTKELKITYPMGYNEQAILYCMNISTPNNNLPIIYHNKKWIPLLKR